jgi:hypothetical protein
VKNLAKAMWRPARFGGEVGREGRRQSPRSGGEVGRGGGGRARSPVVRRGGEVGGGARVGGVPRAAEPAVKTELRGARHGGGRAEQLAGQSSPAYARCRHGRWSGGVQVESENGDAREREGRAVVAGWWERGWIRLV